MTVKKLSKSKICKNMKIVTINVPEAYLESIELLTGENGIYPSRSELIRVAVREFLIKELKRANDLIKYRDVQIEELDEKNFVRVPNNRINENGETIKEFKTYKIIRRLEY